ALDAAAAQGLKVLSGIRGAVDAQVESQPGSPEIVARLRRDRLRLLGFQPVQLLEAVETAYQGTKAAQVFDKNRVMDVVVILHPDERRAPETLGALLVRNAAGTRVPLGQLADIEPDTGRYVVVHEGAQRRQQVTC